MPFRLEHITLADRVELGCACLLAAGQYGLMTDLAAALGTSRQFLYTRRARAQAALEAALAPGAPGRPRVDARPASDRTAVAWAILVLSQVAHASVRDIQECLGEILGVQRSVGAIEAVLQEAAARARQVTVTPPSPSTLNSTRSLPPTARCWRWWSAAAARCWRWCRRSSGTRRAGAARP